MLNLDPRKVTKLLYWGTFAVGVIGSIMTNISIKRELEEAVQDEVAKQLNNEESEES